MAKYVTGMKISSRKGDYCPFHVHSHIQVVYHTGSGVTKTRPKGGPPMTLRFSKGDAIVYPPGWEKDNTAISDSSDYCVLIDARGQEAERFKEALAIRCIASPYALFEMGELSSPPISMSEDRRRELDLRAGALLAALGNEILESSGRSISKAEQLVRQALRTVEESLSVIRTAQEIAEAVGVSPDYLRHLFKAHSGITLAGHVAKARLSRATTLLLHSNMPLKGIAAACGYSSERHLCHVIREAYGTTPNGFRQAERKAGRTRRGLRGFDPDSAEFKSVKCI